MLQGVALPGGAPMRVPPHSETDNAVVRARLARGETQAVAAKRLGVSVQWYCQMERRGWIAKGRRSGNRRGRGS